MQIDIAPHIEKLLFEHDTVIIPSFGGFTATKLAAGVDYTGGTVSPPAKTLVFNENLTIDDGILAHEIARSNGVSAGEARDAIQQFVEKTQSQLGQREIVNLPGVGRLYKNYVQKIQFLPDATNFSPDAFGLPPLQFSPIARSREVAEHQSPAPTAAPASEIKTPATPVPTLPPAPVYPSESAVLPPKPGASLLIPMLVTLLVCCILAGGYWLWQRKNALAAEKEREKTEENIPAVPEKESRKSEELALNSAKSRPAPPPAEKVEPVKSNVKPKEAPLNTGDHQCILVIGLFKDKSNIQRLLKTLQEEGFKTYQQTAKNGAQQIGVQFAYDDASEIQEYILALRQLTGEENIWIKKQ